jgi:Family of unknown function (DUF5681)
MAVDTGPKQRKRRGPGQPFQRGQSGNPAGRRAGARNRTSALAMHLMDQDAEGVILALIKAARGGDVAAIRLVLERVAPLPRNRPVQFDMPGIMAPSDIVTALGAVAEAVAAGELSPEEGAAVAGILEAQRRAVETVEMEARIAALEQSREAPK